LILNHDGRYKLTRKKRILSKALVRLLMDMASLRQRTQVVNQRAWQHGPMVAPATPSGTSPDCNAWPNLYASYWSLLVSFSCSSDRMGSLPVTGTNATTGRVHTSSCNLLPIGPEKESALSGLGNSIQGARRPSVLKNKQLHTWTWCHPIHCTELMSKRQLIQM
jgi:hypothetical protein